MKHANRKPAAASNISAYAFKELVSQLTYQGESNACVIIDAAIAKMGLPEEKCAPQLRSALFLLCRTGLISCDSFVGDTLTLGAETIVKPMWPTTH